VKLTKRQRTRMRTSDPYIDLYQNRRVNVLSRFVTTIFVVGLLLIPMIILYNLSTTQSKFLLILFSTLTFTMILTLLTKARKSEIFVAAATYDTLSCLFFHPRSTKFRFLKLLCCLGRIYSSRSMIKWVECSGLNAWVIKSVNIDK